MNEKPVPAGLFSLLHAANVAQGHVEEKLASLGLSLAKLIALQALAAAGESLPLGQLAERLSCVKSNVTQLIDRLEASGLIAREAWEGDRRVTVAKLTRRGREVFAGMAKAHEGWLREAMADIDDAALALALKQLEAVKGSIARHLVEGDD